MDLILAVEHANRIIDMLENNVTKDIPPQWMWLFPDEMSEWFERVHKENSPDVDSGGPGVENEYAQALRG